MKNRVSIDDSSCGQSLWSRYAPNTRPHADFREDELNKSVTARFEKMVDQYPKRLAIQHDHQALTYDTLNRMANRIAHAIERTPHRPDQTVALFAQDPVSTIAGMFGAMKTGKPFVVFDPDTQTDRLLERFHDCDCDLVLTTESFASNCDERLGDGPTLLHLNHRDSTLPESNPQLEIPSHSTATVHYTSGSTGKAKGVINTHRTMLHCARQAVESRRISSHDRIGLLSTCSGGRAAADICSALLSGASLHPFDVSARGLPALAAWLVSEKITTVYFVPSLFQIFTESLNGSELFPSLRLIALGGESILPSHIQMYRDHFSNECVLRLGLGITETCSTVTQVFINRFTDLGDSIPAGFPLEGTQVLILDDQGKPLPIEREGEIAVKSNYLSTGYWRNPELTKQSFSSCPEEREVRLYRTGDRGYLRRDGCLYHSGRIDFQLKIRGNRVNLEEVSLALTALDGISDAVAVNSPRADGTARLIAYLIASETRPTNSWVRKKLECKLPSYAIPSRYIWVMEWPRTPGGKIDREALPTPVLTRPELKVGHVSPRDELEQWISETWAELLEVDEVGIHDQFFDAGGDSLLAVQMIMHIEQDFKIPISGKEFFPTPTIAHLASLIQTGRASQQDVQRGEAETKQGLSEGAPPNQETKVHQLFDFADREGETSPKEMLQGRSWLARLPHIAGNLLPYSWTFKLLDFLTSRRWLHSTLFRPRVRTIREFLKQIDTAADEKVVIKNSLLFGSLFHHRIGCWGFLDNNYVAENFSEQLKVEGEHRLHDAVSANNGVVLVAAHNVASGWTKLVVPNRYFLGAVQKQLWASGLDTNGLEAPLLSHKLDVARRTLQNGGIVGVAADGSQGSSRGIVRQFHGRLREFHTGFAELALLTGAQVIPVTHSIDNNGQVTVRFGEPFPSGHKSMSRDKRLEILIDRYIELTHRMWSETPWMPPWYSMERHLNLPGSTEHPVQT